MANEMEITIFKPGLPLPKIRNIVDRDNITQSHVVWASGEIDRILLETYRLRRGDHPARQMYRGYRNIILLLKNKETFEKFIPRLNLAHARNPNILRQDMKEDLFKVNRILTRKNQQGENELEFLVKAVLQLKEEKLPQNIEIIRRSIEASLLQFYNNQRLADKVARLSEINAMAEAELLKGFVNEVRAGLVEPNHILELRRQFNNTRLADSIETHRKEIPDPRALPNLQNLIIRINPQGTNLMEFIGGYLTNPQLVIDKKTQTKLAELVEKAFALSYFTAVSNRITRELRGAYGGEWKFFKMLSDNRVINAWHNRLSNGYQINRGDLVAVDLPANYWLLGKRIKDEDIARELANLRHKTITEWATALNNFVTTRMTALARESLAFIRHRINEIPVERKNAFNSIYHLLEGRLRELNRIERRIKRHLIKVLAFRRDILLLRIERTRRKWLSIAEARQTAFNQEAKDMVEFLEQNLRNAYQLQWAYWLGTLMLWKEKSKRKQGSISKRIEKTKVDMVNFVNNLVVIYTYWYTRELRRGSATDLRARTGTMVERRMLQG